LKIYRQSRVVFGVTSSSFLLGAVLELHLSNVEEGQRSVAEKLLRSMYVDNSVTSVDTVEEYEKFREVSVSLLAQAGMELREWESSVKEVSEVGSSRTSDECRLETITSVLGMFWDRTSDTLACDVNAICVEAPLSKRKILTVVAKVFDPIGYTGPVTLQPKLMLQELWKSSKGWDDDLEEEVTEKFGKWCRELHLLSLIKLPRAMMFSPDPEDVQFHLFTDASQYAYAAVVFVRSVQGSEVRVQLVQAKARVAPLKGGTIPRLELPGA